MEEVLMGTQDRMEREINLAELLWNILFSWRQIICCGIIFAILLSGMKYVQDSRSYRAAQNKDTEQEEVLLTVEEAKQVEDAEILMKRIGEFQNYLETSELMQIDPYKKPVVELQYYVESDYTYNYTQDNQSDYTGDLMSLYYNYIRSGEMSKKVIEEAKLTITQADFSELCYVSQNGRTMSVMLTWTEEKKLDIICQFIKSELSRKEAEFQEVGSHKLKLLNESQNVIADLELADKKNNISNTIVTLEGQLTNLKLNMSEQQLELLSNENGEESRKDDDVITAVVPPVFSFRYMVLGTVLGVALVCVWVICKMLFTVKLQSPEEIRTFYKIRLLGEISIQDQKKCFLSLIDEKLLALKNRRKKKLSISQQVKIVSANIALSCKQQNVDCIYLTGSEYESVDDTILKMIKKELLAQNVKFQEGGNIFYDAESLKRGAEIGNMLFIEQVGKSIYDEISNELNLVKEQKNRILGIVVFY